MSGDHHKRGGRVRAERLTPERRSEIARQGGLARRADAALPGTLDEGIMYIGEIAIPCAVLETKQRVLTQSGVMQALGRARQAKGRHYYSGDVNLPAFLTAQNLKPFIPNELYVTSSQIEFRRKSGGKAFGYPAELLPRVCGVFDDADLAGALTPAQKHIATRARLLLRGLADVGIIGMVDEATGYQEKRDKHELQAILAAYLSPTLLPWAERFPLDFFKEMFRVWGWPWPASGVPYKGPIGPRYAGKLIKQVIYGNLPPGVLQELEARNPRNEKWQRRSRNGQLLTEDVGHPLVDKLVSSVGTLFAISNDRDDFWRHYRRRFPKAGDQLELLGPDE